MSNIKFDLPQDEFETGAVRSTRSGRGLPHLLPFDALMELAIHFENGAKGYGPRNWEKGIPLSAYVDSAFRHLALIMQGDESEDHFRAFAWNALCLLATKKRICSAQLSLKLDDLPHEEFSLNVSDEAFDSYALTESGQELVDSWKAACGAVCNAAPE